MQKTDENSKKPLEKRQKNFRLAKEQPKSESKEPEKRLKSVKLQKEAEIST